MKFARLEKPLLFVVTLSLAAALLVSAAMSRNAGHWPMFGGTPGRNMVSETESNMPVEWDAESNKNIKWTVDLGSQSFGGPVVGGGKLLVGTNNQSPRDTTHKGDRGVLMCFREDNGEFLWQATHTRLPAGRVNDWPELGLCSSPYIEGNRAYYVSNRCEVICVDMEGFRDGENDGPVVDEPASGETDADIIWKYDLMRELGVFPHNVAVCAPLVVEGRVFIVTGNGVDEGHRRLPNARAPSFVALDQESGQLLWADRSPGRRVLHGQWSNPAYGVINGQAIVVFPGGDGWIYAFDPAGNPERRNQSKLVWKFDCNPKDSIWVLGGRGTRNSIVGTPVIQDDKVYVGVGQDPEHGLGIGHLWCIDGTKTGNVSTHLVYDKAAPDKPINETRLNQFIPFDNDKHMTKPNPNSAEVWHYGGEDGTKKFDNVVYGRTISTVAVYGDLVFAAELAGFLHCLDSKTGQVHWKYDMLSNVWGSPYVVDGKVYLGDEDGDVVVFEASKEMKIVAENIMDNAVYSTVVATGGTLYLMTWNRLYALHSQD